MKLLIPLIFIRIRLACDQKSRLFQLRQYEKCIAIYNEMKSKGITPSIGIYTDMITVYFFIGLDENDRQIYDKTNVHADIYEEALKMARDVHVNLDTNLYSFPSSFIWIEKHVFYATSQMNKRNKVFGC